MVLTLFFFFSAIRVANCHGIRFRKKGLFDQLEADLTQFLRFRELRLGWIAEGRLVEQSCPIAKSLLDLSKYQVGLDLHHVLLIDKCCQLTAYRETSTFVQRYARC